MGKEIAQLKRCTALQRFPNSLGLKDYLNAHVQASIAHLHQP